MLERALYSQPWAPTRVPTCPSPFNHGNEIPSDFSSFEAQISASECHFSSNFSSKNGTSVQPVFCFETNNSPVNSYDKKPINNNINSFQHQNKAETQFTAFSPLFQHQAISRKCSADYPSQLFSPKPTQTYTKMEKNSPPISLFVLQVRKNH